SDLRAGGRHTGYRCDLQRTSFSRCDPRPEVRPGVRLTAHWQTIIIVVGHLPAGSFSAHENRCESGSPPQSIVGSRLLGVAPYSCRGGDQFPQRYHPVYSPNGEPPSSMQPIFLRVFETCATARPPPRTPPAQKTPRRLTRARPRI